MLTGLNVVGKFLPLKFFISIFLLAYIEPAQGDTEGVMVSRQEFFHFNLNAYLQMKKNWSNVRRAQA